MGERTACTLVMHSDTGRHDTGWGHPEHQGRLPAIMRAIERDTPALLPRLAPHEAAPAEPDVLRRVHTRRHIETVHSLCATAEAASELVIVDSDTVISPATWDAAVASAGCAVDAAVAVATGRSQAAWALCRPPGHHASAERIMGFCFFNNVAVAARAVQASGDADRILIVDWDVHHGNGTQDIFWSDPSVCYVSLHQHPWYPGTGLPEERGDGSIRNFPVAAETPRAAYLRMFVDALDEAFEKFRPDFVLVSAGFDCMAGDPLGRLMLEPADLFTMTQAVMERAAVMAGGRVVLALEGGYDAERTAAGVVASLRALCGLGLD